jgi:hypothetical protein
MWLGRLAHDGIGTWARRLGHGGTISLSAACFSVGYFYLKSVVDTASHIDQHFPSIPNLIGYLRLNSKLVRIVRLEEAGGCFSNRRRIGDGELQNQRARRSSRYRCQIVAHFECDSRRRCCRWLLVAIDHGGIEDLAAESISIG